VKTFSCLWWYLAKVFSEWEMFEMKVVEKMKAHILCLVTLFWKSHLLWDNIEKCDGVCGTTNDITVWCIRIACWICRVTFMCTHTQICNIIACPRQQWFTNMPECYIIETLSCLNWIHDKEKIYRLCTRMSFHSHVYCSVSKCGKLWVKSVVEQIIWGWGPRQFKWSLYPSAAGLNTKTIVSSAHSVITLHVESIWTNPRFCDKGKKPHG
jgi:hypothetical protein